jgi:APA family basic amino acid/polyamine antiporter
LGANSSSPAMTQLRKTIGPGQMAFYALGSMLGSGIYGLIGEAAGHAGNAVWLSFLIAMLAALLTAFTYASLGSRYPRAGGAAYVIQRAFASPMLGFTIGLAVVCSGLASIATQAQVFARNLAALLDIASITMPLIAGGFLFMLAGVVFRGIRESMWVNILCTCVEALGLLIVVATGFAWWGSVDYLEVPSRSGPSDHFLLVVMQGTVLTFFAFIGFEDTINVAEECRDPRRTIPIGLLAAMGIATLLYIAVAITAVSVVPWQDLSEAPGPLTEVIKVSAPTIPPIVFTAITLFAVSNTALVNYITSSRLIYGMAQQGLLPHVISRIHPATQTPHIAILTLLAVLIPLIFLGSIAQLASAAVLLLLIVFALMNAALVILQRRVSEPDGAFEIHAAVPVGGVLICTALVVQRIMTGDWAAPAMAGTMLAAILVVYMVLKRTRAQRAGGWSSS